MNNKIIATIVAVAIAGGGIGFYSGTMYQRKALMASEGQSKGMGNFAGRSNGQAQTGSAKSNGARTANGGIVSGQVTAKDDKSITIKDRTGSSKIVLYSGSTTVGKTVDGSASDLSTGENVMVNGTDNSDGSVTAENIQIIPDTPQGGGGRAVNVTN